MGCLCGTFLLFPSVSAHAVGEDVTDVIPDISPPVIEEISVGDTEIVAERPSLNDEAYEDFDGDTTIDVYVMMDEIADLIGSSAYEAQEGDTWVVPLTTELEDGDQLAIEYAVPDREREVLFYTVGNEPEEAFDTDDDFEFDEHAVLWYLNEGTEDQLSLIPLIEEEEIQEIVDEREQASFESIHDVEERVSWVDDEEDRLNLVSGTSAAGYDWDDDVSSEAEEDESEAANNDNHLHYIAAGLGVIGLLAVLFSIKMKKQQ